MAAGDIITSKGYIFTPEDIQLFTNPIESNIAANSKDPGQYEEVTSLTGITSLPTFLQLGSTFKLVRVALAVLKGVDGKEIELQTTSEFVQWRYTDLEWNNLISLADLKGAEGEKPTLRVGSNGIEWKYEAEDDTTWKDLVSYDKIKLKFADLTTEQIAAFWKGIPTDVLVLFQKPATDAAAEVRSKMTEISQEASQKMTDLRQLEATVEEQEEARESFYTQV